MQFTEHELTLALTGAAKSVAAARGKRRFRRGQDPEEVWQRLTGYERYQVLDGISDKLLPVLAALPEVEVPSGQRPEFSNAQVLAAIEEALGPDQGGLRGKVTTAGRLALVRTALAHLPPRTDRRAAAGD
jgi:hypothetical protein